MSGAAERRTARRRCLGIAWLVATCVVAPSRDVVAGTQSNGRLTDLLAKGKLEDDLGHAPAAIAAFESVAADPGSPAALRGEALVRLGLARRRAGDLDGSARAFQSVAASHRDDPETMRLLAVAVSGVAPGLERWNRIRKEVRLVVENGGTQKAVTRIVWPGGPDGAGARSFRGEPISLDLKDAALDDVLRTFGNLTGLKIVLDPQVHETVNVRIVGMPWDEALERILECEGLVYGLSGSNMTVSTRERLEELLRAAAPR